MVMKVLLGGTGLDKQYEALLSRVQDVSRQSSPEAAATLAQEARHSIEGLADQYASNLTAV